MAVLSLLPTWVPAVCSLLKSGLSFHCVPPVTALKNGQFVSENVSLAELAIRADCWKCTQCIYCRRGATLFRVLGWQVKKGTRCFAQAHIPIRHQVMLILFSAKKPRIQASWCPLQNHWFVLPFDSWQVRQAGRWQNGSTVLIRRTQR